jgi:malate-CoA ligase subunit beta
MDIHEYQAKELLAEVRCAGAARQLAYSPEQAVYRANETRRLALGRSRRRCIPARAARRVASSCAAPTTTSRRPHDALLGKRLVTHQTGPEGKPVQRVYVEVAEPFERELYLGIVLDRKAERVRVIASAEGGMDIEELAHRAGEDHAGGGRTGGRHAGVPGTRNCISASATQHRHQVSRAVTTIMGVYRAFRDLDATMVEINPLVVTKDDRIRRARRQDELRRERAVPPAAMSPDARPERRRTRARRRPPSATSTMSASTATSAASSTAPASRWPRMDMIKYAGGAPANFLDIGGGASPERVANSFRLVLSDANVKAILVNIFAGINRCDWVAQGVVQACQSIEIKVPLIVRLAGTNEEEGRRIIRESGLPIISADTLTEAAAKAVEAAKQQRAAH